MINADLRLDILDSIFKRQEGRWDNHDFTGYALEHLDAYALILLGLASIRPDLPPADFGENDKIRLEAEARRLLDDFVEKRVDESIRMYRIAE